MCRGAAVQSAFPKGRSTGIMLASPPVLVSPGAARPSAAESDEQTEEGFA